MNGVTIRDSQIEDVYAMSRNLRVEFASEAQKLGVIAGKTIRERYRNAILRKTYIVEHGIAAMSGLYGPSMMADVGYPYLMTTALVEKYPIAVVKLARIELSRMLCLRSRLEVFVDTTFRGAVRLAQVLGFTALDEVSAGDMRYRLYFMARD